MKNKINLKIQITILILLFTQFVNGQITHVGNNSANSATDYVGWDNSTTNDPLQIRHNANQPIVFYTNNTRRMKLSGAGDLLIGDYNSFTISNHLVQYSGSNTSTYHQFVTNNSSTGSTDGFRIGVTYNSGGNDAELLSGYSGANMNFWTNSGSGLTQRMTILNGGNVGVATSSPGSRLHVVSTNAINGTVDGTKIEFSNSTSTTGIGRGLNVTSTMNVGSGEARGIQSAVDGALTNSAYYADVNNTNAAATNNYGYNCVVTDNSAATSTTATTGFNILNYASANATVNRGIMSPDSSSSEAKLVCLRRGWMHTL